MERVREIELPGNRWSSDVCVWSGVGASLPADNSLIFASFRRTFCRLVRVVSRPITGVRQTVLDVICGSIAVFRRRSRFCGYRVVASAAARAVPKLCLWKLVSLAMWTDGSTTEVSGEVFMVFALVGGNSNRGERHSNVGSRLAVAWSRNETLVNLVDGEPGYPGFGCTALRGRRCALGLVACGEGRGHGETNTVHWASPSSLEEGQLSTNDAHGCAASLLVNRPLAVFRQENRADSMGVTPEKKFTRADSMGVTPDKKFTECFPWRTLRWADLLSGGFRGNSGAEVREPSSTGRNQQSVLTSGATGGNSGDTVQPLSPTNYRPVLSQQVSWCPRTSPRG